MADVGPVHEPVLALAEHCEMDHEFEVPPGTAYAELVDLHTQRHRAGDHWNHTHPNGNWREVAYTGS